MSTSVSLSFPDSTYSSGNKPSTTTAKSDFSVLETAINTHNAATTGEHGVSGTFVGTSDSQTLTNKTLTSPILNTGISGTAFLDEDNMASDSATKVASQQSIKAYVDAAITATKLALYPIGCIYTSITGTNPNTELGFGTWTAFGAGRTLVGLNSGDTDFDAAEETGGAKTVSIAHTHAVSGTTGPSSADGTCSSGGNTKADAAHTHSVSITSGAMSANATPSIVQPYIVVYFWKRTA